MERARFAEVSAVSRYWTPNHLDVTDQPMRYAPPKPAWIDRLAEHRARVPIDDRDRLARLRMHTRAVVDPTEIPVLPPLPSAPVAEAVTPWYESLLANVRHSMAELMVSRETTG